MKSAISQNQISVPILMRRHMNLFSCPHCGGQLAETADSAQIQCFQCNQGFSIEEGIPRMFWVNDQKSGKDVTDQIKAFYEQTPFPDYEDLDSTSSLKKKAERGIFARLLDRQIPYGTKILEAGCGTGQLTNFLALTAGRTVFGTDMCLNSLKLAQAFKKRNDIENAAFFQMNLFRPIFKPESFHLVISNGVLHHTSDPQLGFEALLRLVKPGGFIVIGLYHRYGRVWTDFRRLIFNLTGNQFKFLDARLRQRTVSEKRKHVWFMDQYKNPHESKHTINEVLGWFDQVGVEFINSIPKCVPSDNSLDEKLFEKKSKGTFLGRLAKEMAMAANGAAEGGFFIMLGRKKGATQ